MPKCYLSAADREKAEEERAGLDLLAAIQTAVMVPGVRQTQNSMADAVGIAPTTFKSRIHDPLAFDLREMRKLVKAGLTEDAVLAVCGFKPKKKQASEAAALADLLEQAVAVILERRNDQ